MSNSALASLTAQYTDSENEDEHRAVASCDSSSSQTSPDVKKQVMTPKQSPEKPLEKSSKTKSKKLKKKALVSYRDDTIISDEESVTESSSTESESEDSSEGEATSASTQSHTELITSTTADEERRSEVASTSSGNASGKTTTRAAKSEKSEKYAHYGFSLPPEPKGKPSVELLEKIRHLYEKMETSNMDMNRLIQERKEFRNPSIYEKLIQFCDINEFGTNYPPDIYDPLKWGPESYYEELARVQKNEMVKRQKERKDNDKIEQATALARKVEEEAKRRKSKWDQPGPTKSVIPTALTTTVTGTKGTVISAFGSLPKKPAI